MALSPTRGFLAHLADSEDSIGCHNATLQNVEGWPRRGCPVWELPGQHIVPAALAGMCLHARVSFYADHGPSLPPDRVPASHDQALFPSTQLDIRLPMQAALNSQTLPGYSSMHKQPQQPQRRTALPREAFRIPASQQQVSRQARAAWSL